MRTKEEILKHHINRQFFSGAYEGNPYLNAMQEYAEEYHQSELLKLNKSDVISSVCTCKVSSSNGKFKMCSNCLTGLTQI